MSLMELTTVMPPKAPEVIARYVSGERAAHIARRMDISRNTIYRWLRQYAPDVLAHEHEGQDVPSLVLDLVRDRLEVCSAIDGIILDMAAGRTPVAHPDLVAYVLSQPPSEWADLARAYDGSALRAAACLRRVSDAVAAPLEAPIDATYTDAPIEPITVDAPNAIPADQSPT